ncbi:MAG: hypothetical protein U0235_08950 [Polyangiaceae bacterium]
MLSTPSLRRSSVRFAAVSAALVAATALTSACHFGCWDPDPDCHGDYDPDTCGCPWKFGGGYVPSYSSPTYECTSDKDCGGRARCSGGRCDAAPGACLSDDECPYGARCDGRSCVCASDVACGEGLSCQYGACEVCLAGDAGSYPVCRALTCDAFGECPAPLTCDRSDLTCRLHDRTPCGDGGSCPPLMACVDGYCKRGLGESDDASAGSVDADAGTDAKKD